jgi:23S rRNA pseudouridine1911/1915/1917 synthase
MIKAAPTASTLKGKAKPTAQITSDASPKKPLTEYKYRPVILFEDTHLLVLDKPAGMLSQGEHRGDENLVDWLRVYLGRPYVGLIHRLDRNTSGVMVVAKRTKSAERLTNALQKDQLTRSYLAWLVGTLPNASRWRHCLQKNEKTNTVTVVRSGGKESILNVKPVRTLVWRGTPLTLAEFILETGRSHQIRVQASHSGFSVLGDRKYGTKQKAPEFEGTALHSFRIRFPHPMSGEFLEFEAPIPGAWDVLSRP